MTDVFVLTAEDSPEAAGAARIRSRRRQMPGFFFSEKVTEEIRLREPSKARMRQVAALGRPGLRMDELQRVLESGAAVLAQPVVFGRLKNGTQIGFLGEEDSVLEKIRAVPLPKEGKKGTPRTVLVKMMATVCRKMAEPGSASWSASLRSIVSLESLLALRKAILAARGAVGSQEWRLFDDRKDIRQAAAKKALAEAGFRSVEWPTLSWVASLGRTDVDEQIVKEGYEAWTVEDTMQQ